MCIVHILIGLSDVECINCSRSRKAEQWEDLYTLSLILFCVLIMIARMFPRLGLSKTFEKNIIILG